MSQENRETRSNSLTTIDSKFFALPQYPQNQSYQSPSLNHNSSPIWREDEFSTKEDRGSSSDNDSLQTESLHSTEPRIKELQSHHSSPNRIRHVYPKSPLGYIGKSPRKERYVEQTEHKTATTIDFSPIKNYKDELSPVRPISRMRSVTSRIGSGRPGTASSNFGQLTNGGLSNRYEKEDEYLKFNLRRDFYCATIWFPYFLHEYYPDLHIVRQLLFSILVYSNFIFLALTCNFFTILVARELFDGYTGICNDNNYFQYKLNPLAVITASILFVLNLISEFKLSIEPLVFWWRLVSFGPWEFDTVKNPDTSVELLKVASPGWNCYLRLIIIGLTQIVSNMILFIVGLATIYNSSSYLDLVKDCLSLIWVNQIDEIIFQYLFLNNSYFRNLWRDTIFEETTFVYHDPKIRHSKRGFCFKLFTNLLSSLVGVTILVMCIHFLLTLSSQYFFCNAVKLTSSFHTLTFTSEIN